MPNRIDAKAQLATVESAPDDPSLHYFKTTIPAFLTQGI